MEEVRDPLLTGHRVREGQVRPDRVAVAATDPLALDVLRRDEVLHDAMRRTLRDPDEVADVPQPHVRILRDAQQDLPVVRQERPGPR